MTRKKRLAVLLPAIKMSQSELKAERIIDYVS